jgi:hypothetical protein
MLIEYFLIGFVSAFGFFGAQKVVNTVSPSKPPIVICVPENPEVKQENKEKK